jgi:hypothetical protein
MGEALTLLRSFPLFPFSIEYIQKSLAEVTSDGNPCKPNSKHTKSHMIRERFRFFFVVQLA